MKFVKQSFLLSLCIIFITSINTRAQVNITAKHEMTIRFNEVSNQDALPLIIQKGDYLTVKNNETKGIYPNELWDFSSQNNNRFNSKRSVDILDSIVYVNEGKFFKDIYTFDEVGNNIGVLFHAQDSVNGTWIEYGKYTTVFDVNGNILTNHAEFFDAMNEEWVVLALLTNVYDDNGNKISLVQEGLDMEGNWKNTGSKSYSYDDNNNRTSAIDYSWDSTNEKWITGFGGFFSYDDEGNTLAAVYKLWKSTYWEIIFRYKYTYDDNNYLISVENNKFAVADSSWTDNTKIIYANNENGDIEEIINKRFNSLEWLLVNKTNFIYDENFNKLTSTGQVWNNGEWTNSGKQTFVYDDNNNFITFLLQGWNSTISEWENSLLLSYTYTTNGNLEFFKSEKWLNSEWTITKVDFWFNINGTRYDYSGEILTAYYSIMSKTIDVDEIKAVIYPNPVIDGEINIALDEDDIKQEVSVVIYNTSAQIIHNSVLNKRDSSYKLVGLDNIPKGIYFLKISNASRNSIYKIMF